MSEVGDLERVKKGVDTLEEGKERVKAGLMVRGFRGGDPVSIEIQPEEGDIRFDSRGRIMPLRVGAELPVGMKLIIPTEVEGDVHIEVRRPMRGAIVDSKEPDVYIVRLTREQAELDKRTGGEYEDISEYLAKDLKREIGDRKINDVLGGDPLRMPED